MKDSFVQPSQGFKKDFSNKLCKYKGKESLERSARFGDGEDNEALTKR